jgi:hypothetical protein
MRELYPELSESLIGDDNAALSTRLVSVRSTAPESAAAGAPRAEREDLACCVRRPDVARIGKSRCGHPPRVELRQAARGAPRRQTQVQSTGRSPARAEYDAMGKLAA